MFCNEKVFQLSGFITCTHQAFLCDDLVQGVKALRKLRLLAYKMAYNKHLELEKSIIFQLIVQLLTSIVLRIKKQSPFIKNFLEIFMKLTMM
jgi:hypothetical protein